MKIASTEIFVLGDPPSGSAYPRIDQLAFLRIRTDEGVVGISEIFSVPSGVAKAALDGPDSWFGHLLIGEDPIAPERLWTKLYNSMLHGNRRGWAIVCIGAVDVALWDIYGKILNRPVYQLLGGSERSSYQIDSETQRCEVIPYCTIVSDAYDRDTVLTQQVERAVQLRELGFRAFKVEPMHCTPETVVDLARLTRKAIGDGLPLCVDVGYLWNDVGVAIRVARQLEELGIFFFETPFPVDLLDAYARLTNQTALPIAVGEHTTTRWEFLALLEHGVQVAQPYMTTVGGLTEAKRVVDLALTRGALVCPGNWSTQVLGAASVHLAAYSPITPLIEFAPAEIYQSPLRQALQEIGLPVVNGAIAHPTAPGIGIELSEDLIRKFRVG